jgi:hypothetical protein
VISLPDLLRRLRRAWAPPGPALARVAPPVDVTARLRAEIQPVLAAVADIQRNAKAIRDDAATRTRSMLDDATHDADQEMREAEQQAPSVRATASAGKQRAVDAEIAATLAAGQKEAKRIAQQVQQRLPDLLESVRSCVLKGPAGA